MSINTRIRELRQRLDKTQNDFAKSIGVKRVTITAMEKDGYTVTEQNIRIICDKFSVSRQWLEQGEGDMFLPPREPSVLEKLQEKYQLSEEQLALVETFLGLPKSYCDVIIEAAEALVRKCQKNGTMLSPEEAAARNAAGAAREAAAEEIEQLKKDLPPEAIAEADRQKEEYYKYVLMEKREELSPSSLPGQEKPTA